MFRKFKTITVLIIVLAVFGFEPMTAFATGFLKTNQSVESLRVAGNQVLLANGQAFIFEGISVYGGLEDSDYNENLPNINAQIIAAAQFWHSNTIRLQVAESNLFKGAKGKAAYNKAFLNELESLVKLARSLNMAVVINDQTEFTSNLPAPTLTTLRFWQVVGQAFKNQPYIIFDLFNEPRMDGLNLKTFIRQNQLPHTSQQLFQQAFRYELRSKITPVSSAQVWHIWKFGADINGTKFIGMQQLVNQIRSSGANNLIWIEGPYWGQRLPLKPYLISGSNIVYSFHHINLNRISAWRFIGKLAAIRPVVDGEWAQYQAPWQECYRLAPKNTPKYLEYLHAHHIGLIAWSLQPGSLLKGSMHIIPANNNSPTDTPNPAQLSHPSTFRSNYKCSSGFGQGSGQLIKDYFSKYSLPL